MTQDKRLNRCLAMFFLGLVLVACEPESESEDVSGAQRALDQLQEKYDELVDDKMGAPLEWASDDLENIGDWEYRVESLSYSSAADLEQKFNELGNDKWEVIWLEKTPQGFMAVLKKPSVSYLSRIPLSQIGKYVIGGPDGQQ